MKGEIAEVDAQHKSEAAFMSFVAIKFKGGHAHGV